MFSLMEYLLAGLPVVSTRSKGGRDFFYDRRYVKVVNATPNAVWKGVQDIGRLKIDPEFVRSETLKKQKAREFQPRLMQQTDRCRTNEIPERPE